MKPWLSAALFLISGCGGEEETEYGLFNCEEDETVVYVGIDEVWTGDACGGVDSIPLRSSRCELPDDLDGNEVSGSTSAPVWSNRNGTPSGAAQPIYKEEVDRASVVIDSPGRGVEEYDMDPDSADEGLYKLTLVSVGSEGELRNDVVRIKLWEEI